MSKELIEKLAFENRLKCSDTDEGWYSATPIKLQLICEAYHVHKLKELEPVGYYIQGLNQHNGAWVYTENINDMEFAKSKKLKMKARFALPECTKGYCMNEKLLAMAKEAGFKVGCDKVFVINPLRAQLSCSDVLEITEKLTKFAELLQAEMVKSAEPVAWMYVNDDGECEEIGHKSHYDENGNNPFIHSAGYMQEIGFIPLYTTPPNTQAQIEELHAKLDEANTVPDSVHKDAERYRWLTNDCDGDLQNEIQYFMTSSVYTKSYLDKLIDEAMLSVAPNPKEKE